jgi:hypothetical protein
MDRRSFPEFWIRLPAVGRPNSSGMKKLIFPVIALLIALGAVGCQSTPTGESTVDETARTPENRNPGTSTTPNERSTMGTPAPQTRETVQGPSVGTGGM